jgi:hypothetical protein
VGRRPKEIDPVRIWDLAAAGRSYEAIGATLGCAVGTLRRRFRTVLEDGRAGRNRPGSPTPTPTPTPTLASLPARRATGKQSPYVWAELVEVPIVLPVVTTTGVTCPHCDAFHAVSLSEYDDVSAPVRCPAHPKSEPLVAVRYREP